MKEEKSKKLFAFLTIQSSVSIARLPVEQPQDLEMIC